MKLRLERRPEQTRHGLVSHSKDLGRCEESDAGRDLGQEEKGMTEDEMAGWMASLARWT